MVIKQFNCDRSLHRAFPHTCLFAPIEALSITVAISRLNSSQMIKHIRRYVVCNTTLAMSWPRSSSARPALIMVSASLNVLWSKYSVTPTLNQSCSHKQCF